MPSASSSKPLRPFFPYYGSKWMMARHYPTPAHDVVCEPFAGSAAYSLHHYEREIYLNDLNYNIATTWQYLINATGEEIDALPDLEAGQDVRTLGLAEGAELLIGWWLNRASSTPKRTPAAQIRKYTDRGQLYWGVRVRDRITAQLGAIKHWRIQHGHADDLVNLPATWFIDPPYFVAGKHYPTRIENYDGLAQWCRTREGQIIVCEGAGADWLPFVDLTQIVGSYSAELGGRRRSTERVWLNG